MRIRIGDHELDLLTVPEARRLIRDELRPATEFVRPEQSGKTDGTGAVVIPVYTVVAGMEFRPHLLNVEADGFTPATPFTGAGGFWQLRVSGRVVDEGALQSASDSTSSLTTNAPVVAPAANAVLAQTAALAAGVYDVYVSCATGPGAVAADAGNMALQLNGVTIARIPVPANGSDTFGPFRVNVPAGQQLQVIAVGVGTAAVPYTASIIASPRASATAASPTNIATQIPFTRNYGQMQGPIAVNLEVVEFVVVNGPANTLIRALAQGTLIPHPDSRAAARS